MERRSGGGRGGGHLPPRAAAVTAQEHLQARLLDLATDAIVARSADTGEILYWNGGAEDLYGWRATEALGRVSHDLLTTRFPGTLAEVQAAMRERGRWEGLLRQTTREGGEIVVASRWVHLDEPGSGLPPLFLEINRDVTAEVSLTEQLRDNNLRLHEAARAREVFLQTVSHELRTPLTAILGFADLLLADDGMPDAGEWRDAVTEIHRAGQTLQRIVDDILDVARLDAGHTAPRADRFVLGDALRTLGDLYTSHAQAQRLGFVVDLPDQPVTVRGDERRTRQVVAELLANAFRFTTSGMVALRAVELDGEVRVDVEDTGAGIDQEKVDLIFEEFRQADEGTTRAHGGAGLGLAIVRRIVEAQGGHVGVDSVRGHGSRFWFTIPMATAED